MKNKKIMICGTNIHPGEMANLALPLPEQYSCSPQYMPIKVIHGKKAGPCLVVFSGLRGTELNGLEIANKIISEIIPDNVVGTVIAIPIMNVYALTHFPQISPSGRDLVSCFPGNEEGSYGERMAHLITNEIFEKADYCIELHTGGVNHNILPQVYCDFSDERAIPLARVFRTPVITNVASASNQLRKTMGMLNTPLLVYQAGEAMRLDDGVIQLGFKGVKNVMRALNMLAKEPDQEVQPIFSREEDWVVAHKGGILRPSVSLGQTIEMGEEIGTISDPFGSESIEHITSALKGVVVGINSSPLVHEGLPIFKIASFMDDGAAENVIETWDKQQPDSFIGEQ